MLNTIEESTNTDGGSRSNILFGEQNQLLQVGGNNDKHYNRRNLIGGLNNVVENANQTVVMGNENHIYGTTSDNKQTFNGDFFVVGYRNTVRSYTGLTNNLIRQVFVTGQNNDVRAQRVFVHGCFNSVVADYNTGNNADRGNTAVVGSNNETFNLDDCAVFGYSNNVRFSNRSLVSGYNNHISSADDSIIAGRHNDLSDVYRSFVGGFENTVTTLDSFSVGCNFVYGQKHRVSGSAACAVFGSTNTVASPGHQALIAGLENSTAAQCTATFGEHITNNYRGRLACGRWQPDTGIESTAMFVVNTGTDTNNKRVSFQTGYEGTNHYIKVGNTKITENQLKSLLSLI